MTICIDLMRCFGDRYRVGHEESYQAERGDRGRVHDPWTSVLRCRHGHIYPIGGEYLAASTDHRGPIANRLAALQATTVLQDGDDGINVSFHLDDFDQVATLMKPRLRRRLSPGQREERIERLREYQFSPATHDAGSERRLDPTSTSGSQAISTRRGVI